MPDIIPVLDAAQHYANTSTTVITGSGTLADNNFSTSSTATETEFDNTDKNYNRALAVLSCSYPTAPDDQSSVDLVGAGREIDGTEDEDSPTATDIQGAKAVGSFKVHNVTTQQEQVAVISLEGVEKIQYSIHNRGGQTMDSDFSVVIIPFYLP